MTSFARLPRLLTPLILALVTGLVSGPAWASGAPIQARSEPGSAPPPQAARADVSAAVPGELETLAAREASAGELESFEGGDPIIIITSSTLAVILVVVLLRD